MECIEEARMGGKRIKDVPIYDKSKKKILGYVDQRATSIGASKEVGAKACLYGKVDGKNCWIVKEERDYKAEYRNYQGTEQQKKNRAKRNNARRRLTRSGRVHKGDGKDIDHKNPLISGGSNGDHNIGVVSKSSNRSRK